MLRAISSMSFSGTLEDKIVTAAQAGFSGIEIFREDIVGFNGPPEAIAAFAAQNGVSILSLQSLRDFEALPPSERKWAMARARRFVDLAVRLGASMLVVCANTRADTLADEELAARDLAELADLAAPHGLRIGYEALASSRHVRAYPDAWRIVAAAARPNLGLIVNAVHSFASDVGWSALETIDADRIFLVHVADAPVTRIDQRLLTKAARLLPGQGLLPLADLTGTLKRKGYAGPFSVEVFNEQVRALNPVHLARDARRSLDLLDRDETSLTRSEVLDVAFMEIACREAEAEELQGLLRALGFAPLHRSKTADVVVWGQGDIRLVVNAARSGLAHAFYAAQGFGVSALGLRVSHIDALKGEVDRSSRADDTTCDAPVLRGPSGSVFYLLEQAYETTPFFGINFEPIDEAHASGHLGRIDHLAQALRPNLLLSELLFYRAVLGFVGEGQRDVLDPHGTVQSAVVSSGNGRMRMSLNSSHNVATTTRRFLEGTVLAGYHHVAFVCDDIFAFARGLPQGIALELPANYHDDLLLRFDLSEELVAEMRSLNILYDRDEDGDYFQLYTRDMNGLFFEIVQRRGYRGLGAANAAVRMLAQTLDYESEHAFDAF